MESKQYLEMMKTIQNCLLEFLDNEENVEEKFQNFISLIQNHKIKEVKQDLKSTLHLIVKISNNHHRLSHFYDKICQILLHFKEEIKQTFSNIEIFNIFKSNKRILLFLIEEGMIYISKLIAEIITTDHYKNLNYNRYFFPEIRPFLSDEKIQINFNEIPDNLIERRKTDEDDNYIREVIRQDLLKEFNVYFKENEMTFESTIKPSIFETNSFLINKEPTLIECAAFFGSIQIFRHLFLNGAKLPPSLWIYSIHGKNLDIIHLLEENKIKPENNSYDDVFKEAIKCYHNELADYIQNKFLLNQNIESTFSMGLKYNNYVYINDDFICKNMFFDLCKYDYYRFVENLIKSEDIDVNLTVNKKIIFYKYIFFIQLIKKLFITFLVNFLNGISFNFFYSIPIICLITFKNNIIIKFNFFIIYKAPLHAAIEKDNVEIIRLLLKCENINANLMSVFN